MTLRQWIIGYRLFGANSCPCRLGSIRLLRQGFCIPSKRRDPITPLTTSYSRRKESSVANSHSVKNISNHLDMSQTCLKYHCQPRLLKSLETVELTQEMLSLIMYVYMRLFGVVWLNESS